jgi:polyphosphate glucokinase
MQILGVDIGGSGIKGAPVDVQAGVLATKRYRLPTPQPSTPDAVASKVMEIAQHFDWQGPIGCTLPSVIKKGIIYSAANIDNAWIGVDGETLLSDTCGCGVCLVNDADAAGIAEMQFGAGRGQSGIVFVLTLGTGIGSALFVDGALMPNTELGHMQIRCDQHEVVEAEDYASDRIRKQEDLGWKEYAARLDEYLRLLESLFSPDLLILGGGVSKKHKKFLPRLDTAATVVPAQLRNEAGIVGAAMAAKHLAESAQS